MLGKESFNRSTVASTLESLSTGAKLFPEIPLIDQTDGLYTHKAYGSIWTRELCPEVLRDSHYAREIVMSDTDGNSYTQEIEPWHSPVQIHFTPMFQTDIDRNNWREPLILGIYDFVEHFSKLREIQAAFGVTNKTLARQLASFGISCHPNLASVRIRKEGGLSVNPFKNRPHLEGSVGVFLAGNTLQIPPKIYKFLEKVENRYGIDYVNELRFKHAKAALHASRSK